MGVNFSPFEIGRRALTANQLGINVTGQNIANVNTPGYSRQGLQLAASPTDGSNLRLVGTGVTIEGVQAFRDRFVESRVQTETGIAGRLTAQRDALAPVGEVFNDSDGSGIQTALNDFFGSFRNLEANPNSAPLRSDVVGKGNALAAAFNTTRARLVQIRTDADTSVRSTVDDANALAQKVADLNARIGVAEHSGSNASELRDQRTEAVRQLAELTGARSVEAQDGSVTLTLSDGRALVVGDHAATLAAVSAPPDGLANITLDGQPANFSDGKISGLLNAISSIGDQISSLDDLAASIAARVNALHTSGTDLDGNAGQNFFAVPANNQPVTAANFAVSDAVKANPRLVVASPLATPTGAATVAGAIANLLTDPNSQAGSRTGSFSSIYSSLVSDAGEQVKSADDALTTQQAVLAQATAQRDSISGVSLDEEAINLLQYQKAYEAAAKFLNIADEMTKTILEIGQ